MTRLALLFTSNGEFMSYIMSFFLNLNNSLPKIRCHLISTNVFVHSVENQSHNMPVVRILINFAVWIS